MADSSSDQGPRPRPGSEFVVNEATNAPSVEAVRDALVAGADMGPKPVLDSTEGYVQVEMFMVRELRRFQSAVNIYMRGYLVFEDLQRQCQQARQFVETANRSEAGYYDRLRRDAWEQVRDAFERRPQGLDDVVGDLKAALDGLRELIVGDESPIYSADRNRDDFARLVSRKLSDVIDQVANLLGGFQRSGLDALDRLTGYVESIFNRSEEARQAVANHRSFSSGAVNVPPMVPTVGSEVFRTPHQGKPPTGAFGPTRRSA